MRCSARALVIEFGIGIGLALGTGLALGGCADDEPPSFPAVEEPSEALRPEAARGSIPEEAHVVDYWIDARLDERAHEIDGTLRMRWRNPTQRSVSELPFHLYMNGFRAEDTVWMHDARGRHRSGPPRASALPRS